MSSSELRGKLTAAREAAARAQEQVAAAEEDLKAALQAEATGNGSAKPARQALEEQRHQAEVAEALIPVLELELRAATDAEAAAQLRTVREQLEKIVAELDEHPAAAAVTEAFQRCEDFQQKTRAMHNLQEQYINAGGGIRDFHSRRLKVNAGAFRQFCQSVTSDRIGQIKPHLAAITGKEKTD